ncbi:hypothetical protein OYT13_15960 [Pandoraea sp. XJJ-1]|uniref:hypothetical protein n=1 Tax=Pandoraea sp. XJJ-1 TaxID=3002643 RepID=UPI00228190A2|nr:hypothetical protein [Pandoraea sp. XJJ-1]WAL81346.1 hypothetical protein OYT13_15960 [Pandoraea sp. XJJ-1]
MTLDEMIAEFDRIGNLSYADPNSPTWEKIATENRLANRQDLHAFMLLESILPYSDERGRDMVCSAEHYQIWLDVDIEDLADKISSAQISELVACGVFYDSDVSSLGMFV